MKRRDNECDITFTIHKVHSIWFAVHPNMRSHTGGLTMGREFPIVTSTKQKLNTRSSTESELVGVLLPSHVGYGLPPIVHPFLHGETRMQDLPRSPLSPFLHCPFPHCPFLYRLILLTRFLSSCVTLFSMAQVLSYDSYVLPPFISKLLSMCEYSYI